MAEIKEISIADKPTLDAVMSGVDALNVGMTGLDSDVKVVNDKLTAARAEKLDSLDAAVTSRASQASVDSLRTVVDGTDTKLDGLGSTVGSRASQSSVDALKSATDGVDAKVGAATNTASSSGTTLFALLKYAVSMFVSYFTTARAAKLDNLDAKVSTRAAQTSVDAVKNDVTAIKTAVDGLTQNGGSGGGIAAVTRTAALHYALGQVGTDGVLLSLNGAGKLRELSVSADGFPIPYRVYADGCLPDERAGNDISFSQTLRIELKEPDKIGGAASLFAVYDMGV